MIFLKNTFSFALLISLNLVFSTKLDNHNVEANQKAKQNQKVILKTGVDEKFKFAEEASLGYAYLHELLKKDRFENRLQKRNMLTSFKSAEKKIQTLLIRYTSKFRKMVQESDMKLNKSGQKLNKKKTGTNKPFKWG